MLLGLCNTTVYSHLVFSVFLKLTLFLFSEVGFCYVAHAGFPELDYTGAAMLVLSKALDVNAKELSLLAYG